MSSNEWDNGCKPSSEYEMVSICGDNSGMQLAGEIADKVAEGMAAIATVLEKPDDIGRLKEMVKSMDSEIKETSKVNRQTSFGGLFKKKGGRNW